MIYKSFQVQRQDIISDMPLKHKGQLMTDPMAFRRLLIRWHCLLLGPWDIEEMKN